MLTASNTASGAAYFTLTFTVDLRKAEYNEKADPKVGLYDYPTI
jgi:hypothetical protein